MGSAIPTFTPVKGLTHEQCVGRDSGVQHTLGDTPTFTQVRSPSHVHCVGRDSVGHQTLRNTPTLTQVNTFSSHRTSLGGYSFLESVTCASVRDRETLILTWVKGDFCAQCVGRYSVGCQTLGNTPTLTQVKSLTHVKYVGRDSNSQDTL